MNRCELAIDEIIGAFLGGKATVRQQYLLRELLRNLVRTARSEYKAELGETILMLQDDSVVDPASRERSRRAAKKLISNLRSKQTNLDFGR